MTREIVVRLLSRERQAGWQREASEKKITETTSRREQGDVERIAQKALQKCSLKSLLRAVRDSFWLG